MLRYIQVCYLLACCICLSLADTCDFTVKFSINSRRNVSGHWIGQVKLEHGTWYPEDGSWDLDVQHMYPRCSDSKTVSILATATAPPPRRADYEYVAGLGYYKIHTNAKNWFEARDVCYQEGGHLLIINSEREAAIIRNKWRKHPKLFDGWRNACAYIGVHDQIKEGEFITVFGNHLNSTGYVKWHPSEPGEGTSGNCLCTTREALLADTGCNNALAYFCELSL
ncbi:hypothetical protein L9F63_016492 [Diploptera punctata]|uniref:C-type lectin domain-containing protein n=1 Tax=Diploptera punctata TaxID=6984 RepID=A0AAD8A1W8_DIPPU|nr:hypothetical protein L9F63_016492 [Diploptera punctata]